MRRNWSLVLVVAVIALAKSPIGAIESAPDIRIQPCLDCHAGGSHAHLDDWRASTHARFGIVCPACHAPVSNGALPARAQECGTEHPVVIAICGRCHQDVAEAFRQSLHFRNAANTPKTPVCTDCHSSAGGQILADEEVPRRCKTCHRRGGPAGEPWVAERTPHLLQVLRQVALARAVVAEQFAIAERGATDLTTLRTAMRKIQASVRDIPYEWHRFNLDDAEARSTTALQSLESIHRQLNSLPQIADAAVSGRSNAAPSAQEPSRPRPARAAIDAPLRLAVSDIIGPLATYEAYVGLFNDLERTLGRPYRFVQRRTYQEINELLVRGELDLAFICSGALVALPDSAPVEIVAVPIVNGRTVYHSLIVTDANSPARGFEDLRGLRFAFTDPLSNTGYLFPIYRLAQLHSDPGKFFSSTLFSGSHDRSILAVYHKLVDAAAVDDMVYRKLVTPESPYWGRLKVIEESPDFPIPPVVAPISVPAELRAKMREFFLGLAHTAEGRERLAALGFDGFAASDVGTYAAIRAMRNATAPAAK